MKRVFKLAEEARNRLRDRGLGLLAARELSFGTYKALDYVALSSSTMGRAMDRACNYFGLVTDAFELSIRKRRGDGLLEIREPRNRDVLPGHYAEYILASLLLRFRFTTGVRWNPREVHLSSPEPADDLAYRVLFEAPVYFGRPTNCLVLDNSILGLVQPNADGELCEVLEWHCSRLIRRTVETQDVTTAVRDLLGEALRERDLRLGTAARKLAMSRRSLQRQLGDAGVSYRELVEEHRRELACRLLRGSTTDFSEVAFALGFSEQSSFYRWFRKWTGKTPLEYLRSMI